MTELAPFATPTTLPQKRYALAAQIRELCRTFEDENPDLRIASIDIERSSDYRFAHGQILAIDVIVEVR